MRRRLSFWLVLLIVCAAFFAARHVAEAQRQRRLAEWRIREELTGRLRYGLFAKNLREVVDLLCEGKPTLARRIAGAKMIVDLPGAEIDPKFTRLLVVLTFEVEADQEVLVALRIVAPQGVQREPSDLWWFTEHARVAGRWLGAIAWCAGVALILLVRTTRRRIAPLCFAAGLVCLLAAGLDLSFRSRQLAHPFDSNRRIASTGDVVEDKWQSSIADRPAWFDAALGMTLTGLLLWVIPSHRRNVGRCAVCGYDLTGNESGICPECGTATPDAIRQQRLAAMAPMADQLGHVIAPVIDDQSKDSEEEDQAPAEELHVNVSDG